MPSIRQQIVDAFCTKIGAQRALRFVDGEDLPLKSVWDGNEEAIKSQYGTHDVTLELQAQVILDSSISTTLSEGEQLDDALVQLQTSALAYDQAFFDLITGIQYTGSQYAYSEDGSSVIGLSAGFEINYQFLTNDPNQQGD